LISDYIDTGENKCKSSVLLLGTMKETAELYGTFSSKDEYKDEKHDE